MLKFGRNSTLRKITVFAALVTVALPLGARHATHSVNASSHREAPLTSQYPNIDSTDLYAFVSPDQPDTVTIIANYIPLEGPAGGPNFYRFGDDTLYTINVDNVGDGLPHIRYDFTFTTFYRNPNTFLYNTGPIKSLDDPNWNIYQSMKVSRTDSTGTKVVGDNLKTPPVNVGSHSTPNYDALASAAIQDVGNGTKVFAGQRADPFFVDLGATFDLLTIRNIPGNMGGGVNTLKGFNVHTIAIQVPISQLTNDGKAPTDVKASNAVLGFWTSASLQRTSVLRDDGSVADDGPFVQVSRLGMPLTNELVVPVGLKDYWNATAPAADSQFGAAAADPELAHLFTALYNIKVPPAPRKDIIAAFFTGLPGINMPSNPTIADELRLNVAIPPSATPNRMGVLGNDLAGFPNGRRLTDDVVDIELNVVAGVAYPLFVDKTFQPDPLAGKLGDGVDAPDKAPTGAFPYVASPYAGFP